MYERVWIMIKLLTLMVIEGENNGIFAPDDEAVDPIDLEPFRLAGPNAFFFSIHPCAAAATRTRLAHAGVPCLISRTARRAPL